MKYRKLGRSGLWISALSLGSWVTFKHQVDKALGKELMALAFDQGVNFFDNAEVYANGEAEILMGQIIHELAWPRDSFLVSSKVFWGGDKPTQRGLSRKHIFDACHAALKRLQVPYLDLFFCHRPDWQTPVEETVFAMNDLIRQGKVMYWGTSEWPAARIMEAFAVAQENHLMAPTMEQPQYNLFHRDRVESEYWTLYKNQGLGTTIWSPLAGGLLTGKYNQGIPEKSRANLPSMADFRKKLALAEGQEKLRKVAALKELADSHGLRLTHLALGWCLSRPFVSTVILGASSQQQLTENLAVLDHLPTFDTSLLSKIEAIVDNAPEPTTDFLTS